MVFSLVIAALVLGIAYFHLVQGLLSGIISMVLAVVAGSLALGYHESIVANLLGGKMGDSANAIVLCISFTIIYGIGRILFDSLIPGNVRVPHMVDVIGGAVCGLVVGIFAAGIFAIAMESMPFGPSILMHSRYAIAEDKQVTVNGARRQETALITGALEEDLPDESKAAGLLIPVDTMVTDYTAFQSESGSMAGSTKLRDRHPNLVRELFLQRVGIENSAKRVALNVGGRKDVNVTALYAPTAPLAQMDGENPSLQRGRNLPKVVKADPSKVTLIARITVAKGATDTDGRFRFSTGSVRLMANGKDFTPVGVLYDPGHTNLLMNFRADDFLLAGPGEITIDLVFIVDRSDVLADPSSKDDLKLKPGTFLEVKRLARVDVADMNIANTMPQPITGDGMIWKKEVLEAIKSPPKAS